MPFLTTLKYPLPLSDYSRAKAVHEYKRAILDGNIAVMTGLEQVASQDEELRVAIQQLRSPQGELEGERAGVGERGR